MSCSIQLRNWGQAYWVAGYDGFGKREFKDGKNYAGITGGNHVWTNKEETQWHLGWCNKKYLRYSS